MSQEPGIAPVLRSQVSDEELARRVEVVQHEAAKTGRVSCAAPNESAKPTPEPTLEDFTRKVNALWHRQAIAALVFAAGKCLGVRIPPKPMILQQAEQVFKEEMAKA